MRRIESVAEARDFVYQRRAKGRSIGLIPTMGALHEGHLSLAKQSIQDCDATVATIFVNPTQFAEGEDLEKYPRTMEEDCRALEATGVDAVFIPTKQEMYPDGYSTFVQPPKVAKHWEGEFRPVHFRGVATIVLKLFQTLPTTHAFFGRKDYQQLKVIEAMVRDLNVGIQVIGCETVRESDGLALSSRNRYLDPSDRQRALAISGALNDATDAVKNGQRDVKTIQQNLNETLLGSGGVDRIDYAVVVDSETLEPIDAITEPAIALVAAHVGETRLIDNQMLSL